MFDILLFLLVLSVLVGVHEFGHFIAAKACGIYVDRFSIGMPPRIFGFKWGETDYCIGALPLGGYVKMAGQEDAPLSEEERANDYGHIPSHRWFNNKPVWQRYIVLIAGPAMNVVLAVVLYAIIGGVGSEVPEFEISSRVGTIVEDSPAASAPLWILDEDGQPDFSGEPDAVGMQTGDVIVTLDGRPVKNVTDLAFAAILDGEEAEHTFVLDRETPEGTITRYASRAKPALLKPEDEFPRFGVEPFIGGLIGEIQPGMPAEAAGLKAGDVIERADGEPVDQVTLLKMLEGLPDDTPVNLTVQRGEEQLQIPIAPREVGRITKATFGASERGADPEEAKPEVLAIDKEYQEKAKLQKRDVITEVNGQPATVRLLQETAQQHPDSELKVKVERPSVLFGLIQRGEELELSLPVDSVRAIGIVYETKRVFYRVPLNELPAYALSQCYLAIERTVLTLKALFSADVSPTQLGGPLMIFEMTTKAAEVGWAWLFEISAFISVNLAVFNLLPLPVLDGGQLVVNGIEAIRRKPLSPIFLERFQQVGLLFIISLMIFVTWNDIGRLLERITP